VEVVTGEGDFVSVDFSLKNLKKIKKIKNCIFWTRLTDIAEDYHDDYSGKCQFEVSLKFRKIEKFEKNQENQLIHNYCNYY